MLEWYEAYADYQDTMRRTENLIEYVALETLGTTKTTFKGHEVDLKAPWQRVRLVDELHEFDLWTRRLRRPQAAALGARRRRLAATRPGRSSSTRRSLPTSSRA